ncbi:MAG: hypothetical protein E6R04_03615 [Spirochaetes bacterium]|nr:MAG: hypothetical protein E6R04_03615 [Spirochaetota bacterium]
MMRTYGDTLGVVSIALKLLPESTYKALHRNELDASEVISRVAEDLYHTGSWEADINQAIKADVYAGGAISGAVRELRMETSVSRAKSVLKSSLKDYAAVSEAAHSLIHAYERVGIKVNKSAWRPLLESTDLNVHRNYMPMYTGVLAATTGAGLVAFGPTPITAITAVPMVMMAAMGFIGSGSFPSFRSVKPRHWRNIGIATVLAMRIRADIEDCFDDVPVGPVIEVVPITTTETESADETLAARIAAVNSAVDQLDREWLDYTLDTEAYFLTKPLLRCMEVEPTRRYREAAYALREACDELLPTSTEGAVIEAERLAEEALLAWGVANDHALRVGVSEMTVTERSALRRLKALVSQLEDPSTPRPMWASLADAISREMDKLVTVPVSWKDLNVRKSLEGRVAPQLMSSVLDAKEEETYA